MSTPQPNTASQQPTATATADLDLPDGTTMRYLGTVLARSYYRSSSTVHVCYRNFDPASETDRPDRWIVGSARLRWYCTWASWRTSGAHAAGAEVNAEGTIIGRWEHAPRMP